MTDYPNLSKALHLRVEPDPHLALWVSIQVAAQRLKQSQDALFKQYGISAAQYNVLRILGGAGADGLPCSAIVQRVIDKDPDMTRMLDRLERAGLVQRWRNPHDRRSVRAAITPAGIQCLNELHHPIANLQRTSLISLDRDEIHCMAKDVDRLIGALDQVSQESSLG